MTTSPWKTGAALALTVAVSYPICTTLYLLWPDRGIEFLNALAHGLDFGKLVSPAPMRVSQFLLPFVMLIIWAFLAGTLFGWARNLLRDRAAAG